MSEDHKEYDVAISFLNEDLGLAVELRDLIGEALDVFVYSAKQEDLAGTDGLTSFRRVFRSDARLVLILYRAGWGETPWTRVEMEAITDRFLKEGPSFLFVVSLDASPPPKWVPDKLIRFSLKDFGIQQLVGAIKARALEAGSAFHQPDIATLATQAAEEIAFANARVALLRSTDGVEHSKSEARRLFALITAKLQQAQVASPSLGIEFGATDDFLATRGGKGGVIVGYRLQWANVLEGAELTVREIDGYVMLPNEGSFYRHRPKERATHVYQPDISRASGWGWMSSSGEFVTSEALADLVARAQLGAIRRQAEESVFPAR